MGRRSGDTQHLKDTTTTRGYDRHSAQSLQNKAIGLSARHREEQTSPKSRAPSRHERRVEKSHARYPFSTATFWFSVVAFASFVLACLYWITYIASTQP